MEICIAVADWARGPMTWVLDVPGGANTGARRRTLRKLVRPRVGRVNRSGPTDVLNIGWTIFGLNVGVSVAWMNFRLSTGWTIFVRGAGMVVGWG
ncbi:hypothetical protein [Streptomyces sp. NPDC056948]|uniref:hypothetical protein n=1 Tax=Streptomyces sp. NPDC056948 TaxID=3345975 RepID=UPI0036262A95